MHSERFSADTADSNVKGPVSGAETFVDRGDLEKHTKTLSAGASSASKAMEREGTLPTFTIEGSDLARGASSAGQASPRTDRVAPPGAPGPERDRRPETKHESPNPEFPPAVWKKDGSMIRPKHEQPAKHRFDEDITRFHEMEKRKEKGEPPTDKITNAPELRKEKLNDKNQSEKENEKISNDPKLEKDKQKEKNDLGKEKDSNDLKLEKEKQSDKNNDGKDKDTDQTLEKDKQKDKNEPGKDKDLTVLEKEKQKDNHKTRLEKEKHTKQNPKLNNLPAPAWHGPITPGSNPRAMPSQDSHHVVR